MSSNRETASKTVLLFSTILVTLALVAIGAHHVKQHFKHQHGYHGQHHSHSHSHSQSLPITADFETSASLPATDAAGGAATTTAVAQVATLEKQSHHGKHHMDHGERDEHHGHHGKHHCKKGLVVVALALLAGLTGQYAGFRSRKCATGLFLVLTLAFCVVATHHVVQAGIKFGNKCDRPMQLIAEGKLNYDIDTDSLEMEVEKCRDRTWHAVAFANGAINLFCIILVASGIWLRRAIRLEEAMNTLSIQPVVAVNGFVCIPNVDTDAEATTSKPDPLAA